MSDFFSPTHFPLSQSKFYPDVNMNRPVFVHSLPPCIAFVPQKVSLLFLETQVMKGKQSCGEQHAGIGTGSRRNKLWNAPEGAPPVSAEPR